jgi:small neutral amino acid transporter SnatA (MarC family)
MPINQNPNTTIYVAISPHAAPTFLSPSAILSIQGLKKALPSPNAIQALSMWGVAAGVGAFWLIQPTEWIKKQLTAEKEPSDQ